MGYTLVTPAATEPITLDEQKEFMRVLSDHEDGTIESLVAGARGICENECRRSFITQTWTADFCSFPRRRGPLRLGKGPIQSVTSVQYYDDANDLVTLDALLYDVQLSTQLGRIVPAVDEVWPDYEAQPDAVLVTFDAGYGDDGTDVPSDIRLAIQLTAAWMFLNREGGTLPDHIRAILSPYVIQSMA